MPKLGKPCSMLIAKIWGLEHTPSSQTALMRILDTAQGKMTSRYNDNHFCIVTKASLTSTNSLSIEFDLVGEGPTIDRSQSVFDPSASVVTRSGGEVKLTDLDEDTATIESDDQHVWGTMTFREVPTDCDLYFRFGTEDYTKCLVVVTHPDAKLLPSVWDKSALEPGILRMDQGLDVKDSENILKDWKGHNSTGVKVGINFFNSLQSDQKELAEFQRFFDGTVQKVYTRDRKGGAVPDRLQLTRGIRIQNVKNWTEYSAHRWQVMEQMRQRGKGLPDSIENLKTAGLLPEEDKYHLEREANDEWLFNGTNDYAAKCITSGDFLVNLAGSNAGTLYGNGVYLAESFSKSDQYTKENESGERCLLLCRATLGFVNYIDEAGPDPDQLVQSCTSGPYHSVLGDREKLRGTFKEIIVYDDNQVYPEYVFWYKRVYEGGGSALTEENNGEERETERETES
ncbi:unnamed protein product [Polarella glacialis]|nr:unnamed protein product [Polarella glacialis]